MSALGVVGVWSAIGLGCRPEPEPAPTPSDGASAPQIVSGPEIAEVAPNVWLARRLLVRTSVPTRAVVEIDDGARRRTVSFPALAEAHDLPLLGLRPDARYEVTVTLTEAGGRSVAGEAEVASGPLDVLVPRSEVLGSDPARKEPGYLLVPAFSEENALSVVVAYDPDGAPVYVARMAGEIRALGAFGAAGISGLAAGELFETDLLGAPIRLIDGGAVGEFHHEARRLDDGTLLTLAKERREVASYPTDPSDPWGVREAVQIEADVVVEVGPDGAVAGTWPLADLLDVQRIGFDSTDQEPDGRYIWSHANAVEIDPSDGALVASARHQDAVVKFDRSGAVRWILANPDGWGPEHQGALLRPVGEPFSWPYHQHAPMLSGDGRIVMFDNGNWFRTTPYSQDPDPAGEYSRVVEYEIDPVAMEIRQRWAFVGDGQGTLFSTVVGNADYLPRTGHVLATYAWLNEEGGVSNRDRGRGKKSVRVIEIDPERVDAVWDLSLYASEAEAPLGWAIDRAIWVPSLYGTLAEEITEE